MTSFHQSQPNVQIQPELPLLHEMGQEALRQHQVVFNQSQRTFQCALTMTVLSAIVSLAGVGLLVSGQASEGTITTAGGLVSGAGFMQLSKEAEERLKRTSDRLDKIAAELADEA